MKRSSIEIVEEKLPPGFRFYPRDEELICDYLMNKVVMMTSIPSATNSSNSYSSTCAHPAVPQLIEVDLNKCDPWEIPETASVRGKEWYFYNRRDRKYATGLRTNRATATGYWKATGKDRAVHRTKGELPSLVGMRKTLVFYRGRAPKGRKSDWVMHEFRIEGLPPHLKFPYTKEDWVLCRVFHKVREDAIAKPLTGIADGRYYDDHHVQPSSSSSSLPSLTADPYVSFEQTPPNSNIMMSKNHSSHGAISNIQVPCFSIFSQNQTMSYCYPNMITASTHTSEHPNAPLFPLKACISNNGGQNGQDGGMKQESHQQSHHSFDTNLKVKFNQITSTSDAASTKLKSKEDFVEGNNSPDSYMSESMWRHQQY